jgi:SAM-dependent methyltransferase
MHWNDRALNEKDRAAVNIADVTQRELETAFVLEHLRPADRILEVGCGNGFLTGILRERVAHVDAFDYSENMVAQAIALYGDKNNRFFHDNVLQPARWRGPYDAAVCVRVLINLRDLAEQKRAVDNIASALKPGSRLILVEGFSDGFGELNRLRERVGMKPLKPAAINFYSTVGELRPHIDASFVTEAEFHSGCFDLLTRVVYPALVGEENATGHSDFHRRIRNIAERFNPEGLERIARLRGYVLVKR